MSAANRLRAIPWILGICLGAASLIGANRLLNSPASAHSLGRGAPAPKSNKAQEPWLSGGTVVTGTVDSEPSPAPVGPPAVAALSTVKKVLVREGQEVKPGDPLVQFDDAIFRAKLEEAQAELMAAELEVKLAGTAKQNHAIQLGRLQAALKAAEESHQLYEDALRTARNKLDRILEAEKTIDERGQARPLTEIEKERRRREDLDLKTLEGKVIEARAKADDARKQLDALQLEPVDVRVEQAGAKVRRLQATVRQAQAAVNDCLVKADVAGVVEQLSAAPGMTYGPSTRVPVLILVPAGTRIIRADVEAEFAYKVADAEGKRVTIYDHHNFELVYDGVVRRVGTAFLSKRAPDAAITVNPTKVLEVLIDVPDPTPSGRPPLRVGQPVRVAFP